MEIDYVGALVQWLMFFGLMSIFLLPAFLFRNIANKNGEKGWVYFLLGLGFGMFALQAGRLMIYILTSLMQERNLPYMLIVMYITAYAIIGAGVAVLKKRKRKMHN